MTKTHPDFVITRTFDAPRDLVWQAFTEGESLAQWWGPKGFATHVTRFEFRPGGKFVYAMRSEGGNEMWGRFVYQEITPPERLVFINSFSDENGGLVRGPFSEKLPLEMLLTLTFEEENGKTTLTLRGRPINATEEEKEFYASLHPSMRSGFGGTFDQLEAYLARQAG